MQKQTLNIEPLHKILNIYKNNNDYFINLNEFSDLLNYKSGPNYLKNNYKLTVNDDMVSLPELICCMNRMRKPFVKEIATLLIPFTNKIIVSKPSIEIELVEEILEEFAEFKFIHQYKCNKYFIDMYSPIKNIAIEIDENGHIDRDIKYEKEREEKIKETLKCKIIRINPHKPGFKIGKMLKELRELFNHENIFY